MSPSGGESLGFSPMVIYDRDAACLTLAETY